MIKLKNMKNTLLAILFALMAELATAQTAHHAAPERVRQSFSRNFPEARDAHWSHTGGRWNATFDDRSSQDRGEMVAHFDEHGGYIESQIPYAENDVPRAVDESARKRYHHGRYHVTMIDHPSRPDVYEVRGDVNGRRRISYYDERGRERSYNGNGRH
jgi:hypothetical protein